MNCIHNRQLLTVPSGNDFRIHLCRRDVAPGNHADVTFVDIQDLEAYVTGFPNLRIITTHQVHDDGDIIVDIDSTKLQHYTYGIELTGRYNGHPWRWKCDKVFKVSDTNCESSVQGMESFGVETYYLGAASPGKIYYGAGETESSATTVFSNLVSPAGTYNVTVATTGHYIFFVIPNSMSISSATMSGFDFPLSEPTATTMGGEAYKVYKSDSPIDAGIYEIVIK